MIAYARSNGFDIEDGESPSTPTSSSTLFDVVDKLLREQPFCFFRISYGEELQAHFGDVREFSSPRMRRRERGSYILGTRASSWAVYSKSKSTLLASDKSVLTLILKQPVLVDDVEMRLIEEGGYIAAGTAVKDVSLRKVNGGIGLRLRFLEGSRIYILPAAIEQSDASDDSDDEISDWELLDSNSHLLSVGPGLKWTYDEAD